MFRLPRANAQSPVLRRMDGALPALALLPRRGTAHKGDHGRVLVIGGFAMAGAARLAGESALRTGAGVVTIATGAAAAATLVGDRPELIARVLRRPSQLASLLDAADAVAIGPGLGIDRHASRLLDEAIDSGRPLVVDADALSLLATKPRRHADWILTPHPGEAGRLLGSDAATVQGDRLAAAREVVDRFGGVCVLKGAGTLVKPRDELAWICDRGNPGMATAGSGDVLTGVIAALLGGGVRSGTRRRGGRVAARGGR